MSSSSSDGSNKTMTHIRLRESEQVWGKVQDFQAVDQCGQNFPGGFWCLTQSLHTFTCPEYHWYLLCLWLTGCILYAWLKLLNSSSGDVCFGQVLSCSPAGKHTWLVRLLLVSHPLELLLTVREFLGLCSGPDGPAAAARLLFCLSTLPDVPGDSAAVTAKVSVCLPGQLQLIIHSISSSAGCLSSNSQRRRTDSSSSESPKGSTKQPLLWIYSLLVQHSNKVNFVSPSSYLVYRINNKWKILTAAENTSIHFSQFKSFLTLRWNMNISHHVFSSLNQLPEFFTCSHCWFWAWPQWCRRGLWVVGGAVWACWPQRMYHSCQSAVTVCIIQKEREGMQ